MANFGKHGFFRAGERRLAPAGRSAFELQLEENPDGLVGHRHGERRNGLDSEQFSAFPGILIFFLPICSILWDKVASVNMNVSSAERLWGNPPQLTPICRSRPSRCSGRAGVAARPRPVAGHRHGGGAATLQGSEKSLGIPRATLHRLLAALASRRLVRYDDRTRTYHVGMRVLELSRRSLDQSAIIRAAKPELSRVARRLQRTICVMVLDDEDVFVLDFEDADPSYGRLVRFWPRARAVETAAGRAMLAALPKERSEAFLVDLTAAADACRMDRLRADLAVAKALGYAVMPREPVSGRAGRLPPFSTRPAIRSARSPACSRPINCPPKSCTRPGGSLPQGRGRPRAISACATRRRPCRRNPKPPITDRLRCLPPAAISSARIRCGTRRGSGSIGSTCWRRRCAGGSGGPHAGKLELPHLTAGIAFDDKERIMCAGQHGIHLLDPDSGASTR